MNEDTLSAFNDRLLYVYCKNILQKEHSLSSVKFLMQEEKKKIWRFRLKQLSEE